MKPVTLLLAVGLVALLSSCSPSSEASSPEAPAPSLERPAPAPQMVVAPSVAPPTVSEDEDPIVYVTKSGTKYHRAGCRYLTNSAVPVRLSEAKQRYAPCRVCKPPQ